MQTFEQFVKEYANARGAPAAWILSEQPNIARWLRSKHELIESMAAHNALMVAQVGRLQNENTDLRSKVATLENEAKALRAANDVLQAAFNDRSLAALPARDDPFSGKLKSLVDYAKQFAVEPESLSPEDALIGLYNKLGRDIAMEKSKNSNLAVQDRITRPSEKKLRKILKLTKKLLGDE